MPSRIERIRAPEDSGAFLSAKIGKKSSFPDRKDDFLIKDIFILKVVL